MHNGTDDGKFAGCSSMVIYTVCYILSVAGTGFPKRVLCKGLLHYLIEK